MTLAEFVKTCGSQEAAARKIGVSFTTVNRWLNKHTVPRGLARARLQQLGVTLKD